MWKNSLKNVECDNNKILYETLLDFFFLQRIGAYFLNKPRNSVAYYSESSVNVLAIREIISPFTLMSSLELKLNISSS